MDSGERTRERRGSTRGLVELPLPPATAICLCCWWGTAGPRANAEARAHRDETGHVTLAAAGDTLEAQGPLLVGAAVARPDLDLGTVDVAGGYVASGDVEAQA